MPKDHFRLKALVDRESARLLVLHRDTGAIEHRFFRDLIDYLEPGDLVVANNTKVTNSIIEGEKEKTGARVEVQLLRELNEEMLLWDVIVDPARKIRIGNKIFFEWNGDSLVAEVVDNTTSRGRTIRFLFDGSHDEFISIVRKYGKPPIPIALRQQRGMDDENRGFFITKKEVDLGDNYYYQTVFAKVEGGVLAPTAGMHFEKNLLKRMELKDVQWMELTLHTGLGEFKEIEVEDLSKHRMDAEEIHVSQELCDAIEHVHEQKHRVCCVGTTTMRALESAVTTEGNMAPFDGWTNKFIFPPYKFSIADMMVTGFHMPESSQFIMASAFAGPELLRHAYEVAIGFKDKDIVKKLGTKEVKAKTDECLNRYNFGTYGDAMLII